MWGVLKQLGLRSRSVLMFICLITRDRAVQGEWASDELKFIPAKSPRCSLHSHMLPAELKFTLVRSRNLGPHVTSFHIQFFILIHGISLVQFWSWKTCTGNFCLLGPIRGVFSSCWEQRAPAKMTEGVFSISVSLLKNHQFSGQGIREGFHGWDLMVVVGFLGSLAIFWRLFFLMFRQGHLPFLDVMVIRKTPIGSTKNPPMQISTYT